MSARIMYVFSSFSENPQYFKSTKAASFESDILRS